MLSVRIGERHENMQVSKQEDHAVMRSRPLLHSLMLSRSQRPLQKRWHRLPLANSIHSLQIFLWLCRGLPRSATHRNIVTRFRHRCMSCRNRFRSKLSNNDDCTFCFHNRGLLETTPVQTATKRASHTNILNWKIEYQIKDCKKLDCMFMLVVISSCSRVEVFLLQPKHPLGLNQWYTAVWNISLAELP